MTRIESTFTLVASALCGCSEKADAPAPPAAPATPTASAAPEAAAGSDEASLPFVGRAWLTSDGDKPRGALWIFLANGTLVMDSCFETFRIIEWRNRGDNKIAWREDEVPIEAEYSQPNPDSLTLTVH